MYTLLVVFIALAVFNFVMLDTEKWQYQRAATVRTELHGPG